jgi:hypothetical protein
LRSVLLHRVHLFRPGARRADTLCGGYRRGAPARLALSLPELIAAATLARARPRAGDTAGARHALDSGKRPRVEIASPYDAILQCADAEIALAERRYLEAYELAQSAGERAETADIHRPAVIAWRPPPHCDCQPPLSQPTRSRS